MCPSTVGNLFMGISSALGREEERRGEGEKGNCGGGGLNKLPFSRFTEDWILDEGINGKRKNRLLALNSPQKVIRERKRERALLQPLSLQLHGSSSMVEKDEHTIEALNYQ